MPKAMTILLIGLLAVVALGTVAAAATPVLWFSITAPLWSDSSRGQPTEVVVPQPASTTQPAASPAPTSPVLSLQITGH